VLGRRKIEEDWPFAVSDAAIRYRVADGLGRSAEDFDCGPGWWAEEITEYVRAKSWVDHRVIVPLEFGLAGKSVGFAFLVLGPKRHPDASSSTKAMYQMVVIAGIDKQFQGTEDPDAPPRAPGDKRRQNLSVTMFRGIEEYSRGRPEQPVGLWLQVRVENERAIGFYRKIGFEPDETLGSTSARTRPTSSRSRCGSSSESKELARLGPALCSELG